MKLGPSATWVPQSSKNSRSYTTLLVEKPWSCCRIYVSSKVIPLILRLGKTVRPKSRAGWQGDAIAPAEV